MCKTRLEMWYCPHCKAEADRNFFRRSVFACPAKNLKQIEDHKLSAHPSIYADVVQAVADKLSGISENGYRSDWPESYSIDIRKARQFGTSPVWHGQSPLWDVLHTSEPAQDAITAAEPTSASSHPEPTATDPFAALLAARSNKLKS